MAVSIVKFAGVYVDFFIVLIYSNHFEVVADFFDPVSYK